MVLRSVLRQLHRRLSLRPMLGLLFVVGVFVPIGVLLNLPATPKNVDDGAASDDDDGNFAVVHLKPQVRTLEDENDGASLKRRIAELERLRDAVRNDVRDLERRRQSIQQATQTAASRLEETKSRRNALAHDVAKAKAELQATRADLRRLASQRGGGGGVENDVVVVAKRSPDESRGGVRLVEAVPPKRVIVPGVTSQDAAAVPVPFPGERMAGACRLLTCFDFSRCSLTTPFAVHLYDEGSATDESALLRRLALHIKLAPYYTSNPNRACLYLVLVDSRRRQWDENAFKSLAHWRGDGRNHLLVDVTNSTTTDNFPDNVGRAIVARHSNPRHRRGFDVVAPPIAMFSSSSPLPPPPRQLPAFRRYLIYFRGEWNPPARQPLSLATTPADLASIRAHDNEELVVATECTRTAPKDATVVARPGEWHLCGTSSQRVASLSSSTFALILGGGETTTHARLVESLRAGAVPIVVGDVRLPFDDVLDWSRVAFRLADARATELNFFLRAVAEGDVLDMRRRGRFVWETYFGSATRVVDSVVAVVRTRIGLPPNVVAEARTVGVFADGETSPFGEAAGGVAAVEAPSPRFQKNFTLNSYDAWNDSPGALVGMPSVTPFVSALPSGFQYMGPGRGKNLHRTVRDGGPLNGPEFDVLLAGNVPDEQFTIVMLTFDRNLVLTAALERLRNLQYLRTIVVVWNNPQPPPANMEWPNIGIPIHVSAKESRLLLIHPQFNTSI